jgi:hypothetical protein
VSGWVKKLLEVLNKLEEKFKEIVDNCMYSIRVFLGIVNASPPLPIVKK